MTRSGIMVSVIALCRRPTFQPPTFSASVAGHPRNFVSHSTESTRSRDRQSVNMGSGNCGNPIDGSEAKLWLFGRTPAAGRA
jgi:hypothetical protein